MIRIKQFKKIALFIISVLLISGMVYGGVEYSIGSNSLSGTVLDESTKLRWTRCSINDSGEGDATSSCVQSHIKVTWENALITCESLDFAGINDWRLPNVRELLSIVDYSEIVTPVVEKSVFPNTYDGKYWTSTTFNDNASGTDDSADYAWSVDFQYGNSNPESKTANYNVRCVTGP